MKKWPLYELKGFYVVITLGMVVFSLLTYLPGEDITGIVSSTLGVTIRGAIWGVAAFLCFVLIMFTFMLETAYDALKKRWKKW